MYGTEFEVKLRNELTQKAIAKECAEWIRKKVTFKSNVTNENMMGFINLDEKNYIVALKKKDFDDKTIITISKLIPQNMLLILECGDEAKLATYHTKLMQTEWKRKGTLSVELKGLDLDSVWENIIMQIGGITIDQGNTLDEQIAADEYRQKIEKKIAKLEKQVRAEKQPKKKFELAQRVKALKKLIKELNGSEE